MTRDDAYRVVQENAQKAWDTGTELRDLLGRRRAAARPRRRLRLRRLPHPPARDLGRLEALQEADRVRGMILYTCGTKTMGPGFAHPCAKAGNALKPAGYEYEFKTVGGYRLMPWTWASRKEDRAEIRKLSGTDEVPILVLDDGEVVSGSGTIAKWRRSIPPARPSDAYLKRPRQTPAISELIDRADQSVRVSTAPARPNLAPIARTASVCRCLRGVEPSLIAAKPCPSSRAESLLLKDVVPRQLCSTSSSWSRRWSTFPSSASICRRSSLSRHRRHEPA